MSSIRRRRQTRRNAAQIRRESLSLSPRQDVIDEAERQRRHIRAQEAVPIIDTYRTRQIITDEQHRHAERFYGDWWNSGFAPRATSLGEAVTSSGAKTPGTGPRYVEYMHAMKAVGIGLSPMLVGVVLEGHGADKIAAGMGYTSREGITLLRAALNALGVHYRG